MSNFYRILFGNPMKTSSLSSERLTKFKALAIFASDVLSSVAYATEEILVTLAVTAYMLAFSVKICSIICLLIAVVSISYWQTIRAYPTGGGAFIVAKENLGEFLGLIAASALMIDYTLTVTVSISAGALALQSAFPILAPYKVSVCFTVLLFITWINLRGAKESADLLSIPTYCFISLMLIMIISGVFTSANPNTTQIINPKVAESITILILLRAFASGCSAMTGIEAISSGVTAFKKPQFKNAQITLLVMGCILTFLFIGITYAANKFHLFPNAHETLVSQVARTVFGGGIFYYTIQIFTALILLMAANTAFASFPRLASVLAKEKYIPTRFANIGDRLAFTNGIILLSVVSAILLFVFNCDTHSLIPLYSLGVFVSLTLSQAGMVKHWLRIKGEMWYVKAMINFVGASATFVTLLIIIEGKFKKGAWVVMILMPILIFIFTKVNRRYGITEKFLNIKSGGIGIHLKPINKKVDSKILVPVSKIHKGTMSALQFAVSLSNDVEAVVVNINNERTDKLRLDWSALNINIPLIVLESPYRSVINPFLEYLEVKDNESQERGLCTLVIPTFIPSKFWHNIMHNQTVVILKTALLYGSNGHNEASRVIVEIPYKIGE